MNPAFTLDSTYIHLRPDESALTNALAASLSATRRKSA